MSAQPTAEPKPNTPEPLDEQSYVTWFTWSHQHLNRDLDAHHAAAAAACRAEAEGRPTAGIELAARGAGSRPGPLAPRLVALAEWAYWAESTVGSEPSASLEAARQAVAELESTHDLVAATRRMRAVLGAAAAPVIATPTTTALVAETAPVTAPSTANASVAETPAAAEPSRARGARLPGAMWLAAIAVVVVGLAIGLWALVISPQLTPPIPYSPPSVSASAKGDYTEVVVAHFPADQNVYILVDGSFADFVTADGSGQASTVMSLFPGQHTIAACEDSEGSNCPATTTITQ